MEDLVDVGGEKRVGGKWYLCDLQKSCCAKRRKVVQSLAEAVGLAMELDDDAVAVSSPGAGNVAKSRTDDLPKSLAYTKAEVIQLTPKLSVLKEARDKRKTEREELLGKVQTDAKKSEEHVIPKENGALLRYHGVLQSIQGIGEAVGERSACPDDRLIQLQLLFEKGRKV